jgi:hypothetical protein
MSRFSWVFVFLFNNLQAQVVQDNSVATDSISGFARQLYFTQRGEESSIYNGTQHNGYSALYEGHAYFWDFDFQKGWVVYDHALYENIQMKYDVYKDQLIVAPKGLTGISIALFSPRISEFSFNGYRFVRANLAEDTKPYSTGFYQELVKGKLTALVKRIKTIEEKTSGASVTYSFVEEAKYYLCKQGSCYPIRSKDNILEVMKDQRKEVQQYLSKNKLNYRKQPEQTIKAVAEFYNRTAN